MNKMESNNIVTNYALIFEWIVYLYYYIRFMIDVPIDIKGEEIIITHITLN